MTRFCVCVPARDEAERLPRMLAALADQDIGGVIPVVVALNNTSDLSCSVLEDCASRYADRLQLAVGEWTFSPSLAHAGSARRKAMEMGLDIIGLDVDGVLLTTDADARPPRNWISANLDAVVEGSDIVGGRLVIDEAEMLPEREAAIRALWDNYWASVRHIEDTIDPISWDRPPRHGDHTGASLAITVELYRRAGGVPILPIGEDRALVLAAIAAGGRLSHPESVWMRVSPRQNGRAVGGMAEAMAALYEAAEQDRVMLAPNLDHWRVRALWRKALRLKPGGTKLIAQQEALLPPLPCDTLLTAMGLV